MKFVKIKVLPNGEEQLINLAMVKRIVPDGKTADGFKKYELKFEGTDISVNESQAKKIFDIIGVRL